MTTLTLTVATINDTDYDDNAITFKQITGDIDGVALPDMLTCDTTKTDTEMKTTFKTNLTTNGYTWDTEA